MPKSNIAKIEKPWGYELLFAKTNQYIGKILHINKGHKLSLQYHQEKEETIYLHSGHMLFVYEESKDSVQEFELKAGDAWHIPPQRKHRMIALEDCEIFEVSTPQLHDVVRLEDQYGRTK